MSKSGTDALKDAEESVTVSMCNLHIPSDTAGRLPKEAIMTDREHFTASPTELPTPLSVLYSVVEDAQRNKDYLKENAQGLYDQELADFLSELRDETSRRAKRAEDLLAQRLADGGVH
jgi:hypothetical protein